MNAPDSSVLIAGADPFHPFHSEALDALSEVRARGVLVAHTIAEVHAVMTGAAYARTGSRIAEYLSQFLDRPPVGVGVEAYPEALEELAAVGVAGGAVYDGLIAIGAREAGATLVSLDRRAAPTYRRVSAAFDLLLDKT